MSCQDLLHARSTSSCLRGTIGTTQQTSPCCPQGVMSHDWLSSAVRIMWLAVGLQKRAQPFHFTCTTHSQSKQQTSANIMWTNWTLLFHERLFLQRTRHEAGRGKSSNHRFHCNRFPNGGLLVGCPNVGLQLSTPAMRCASKSLHATEPFQMVPTLGKFRVSNVEKNT